MFSPSDFAAYEERKWSSNAFTLERMKVREKFVALQHAVAGLFGPDFAAHISPEHPSIENHKKVDAQWLYFTRSAAQAQELAKLLEKTELRPDKIFNVAPQDKHATLAVVLNNTRVTVGLIVHAGAWVDRKNFATKLDASWNRERLNQVLPDLPLMFDDEAVTVEALPELLLKDDRAFRVARVFTPEETVTADLVKETFTQLLPLYQFITWSRDNDHIAVGEQMQQQKKEQRKSGGDFKVGDKVRVSSGMFAGKVGAITAIDAKAAKVQVGAMSVNVAAADLKLA